MSNSTINTYATLITIADLTVGSHRKSVYIIICGIKFETKSAGKVNKLHGSHVAQIGQNMEPTMDLPGDHRIWRNKVILGCFHWLIRSLGRLSLASRTHVSIYSLGGGKPRSKKVVRARTLRKMIKKRNTLWIFCKIVFFARLAYWRILVVLAY